MELAHQQTAHSLVLQQKQCQRSLKEKEETIGQLNEEIDNLKQERDLYKDRVQRALRESQTHREQLERQISTNSEGLIQNIRSLVGAQRNGDRNEQTRAGNSNSASNQQEINLQREIMELRSKYERQLQQQKEELGMRTRDLQKLERKNLKYRENNKILSDAVTFLENRNITPAAGSGSNQNEAIFNYQTAVAETNQDLVEQMDFDSGEFEAEEDQREDQVTLPIDSQSAQGK